MNKIDFNTVKLFEEKIAEFFGSPYCVAVDSCTHGIELALRYLRPDNITCPIRTYPSIPFLAHKLNIKLNWTKEPWQDYYFITPEIADAAVLWQKNSYIIGKYMGISFQRLKHLNLIKGGALLVPNKESYDVIKAMSYDGRPDLTQGWRTQNIRIYGYHYYLEPEKAALGLSKLQEAIDTKPRQWVYEDWPNLLEMDIFKPNDTNRELEK